jgi:hypothetical protein
MQVSSFDEEALFAAIAASGARALLIGRRALAALGLPVLTADYDYWIHIDDISKLNEALGPLALSPSHAPEQARQRGRYVLENDEHIDVLVARVVPTVDGVRVRFDEVWERRVELQYSEAVCIAVPALDDLILTKRWATRDRDVADLRLLEALKARRG